MRIGTDKQIRAEEHGKARRREESTKTHGKHGELREENENSFNNKSTIWNNAGSKSAVRHNSNVF